MVKSQSLSNVAEDPVASNRRVPAQLPRNRVDSIDIFRGLTMVVMVFVNQIAEMKGLPWWTYHMAGSVNGMTYVDMVFPFFLFIVGMSIPLAIRHRVSKGDSEFDLWRHVALRSLGLILLGLILANSEKVDAQATGIGGRLWTFLALAGAILFWNIYPRSLQRKNFFKALKFSGALLMLAMLIIFRRVTNTGNVSWLDFSYWEILGMIGWTYLGASIFYLPTRRWRWSAGAWFVAFSVLNVLCAAHWITLPYHLPFYIWPLKSGAGASMVMAGILTSTLFLSDAFKADKRRKTVWALATAALLFVVAATFVPLGISKLKATPTYCLICAAAAVIAFVALYWICDVRRQVRWASFARPAGSNTLLTYLLPDLSFAIFGRGVLIERWNYGWPGALQAALFTAIVVAVSAMLSRFKIRVQL
jgi:heparan-alpha-glucosaminide N-acetyltransferase